MRIKNVGKCLIIFNGGSLPVGMVADFQGEAEKIGLSLLKAYPKNLLNLDEDKPEETVTVTIKAKEEPKAEPKAEPKPVKKVVKKTTKKVKKK